VIQDLAAIAADQGGAFRRGQALAAGYTPRQFRSLTKNNGEFVRVRYGVYAQRSFYNRLTDAEKAVLSVRGAMLFCDPDAVASHTSATHALQFPVYGVHDDLDHVTRHGPTHGRRRESGVVHHTAELWTPDIVDRHGMACTSPERATIDVAREYGFPSGLVVGDAALAGGASKERMLELAELTCRWPNATVIQAVVRDVDGRSESPGETLMRPPLLRAGIGPIELQKVIRVGDQTARVDAYASRYRHIFEFDGWLKYDPELNGGVDPKDVLKRERRRERWLRGLGFGLSRFEWYEVQPDRWNYAVAKIQREIYEQSQWRLRRGA
jgi:hypothetical protein